ncbi:MAG: virulence RhuM family protein [Bacteroidales bacterium]|jgi:hypothetical protein|nr:virulence RhuM family protein [Bacteroidales bacterium]
MTNEIILYQSDELPERIEVRMEDDTVWLSQQQMADLFGRGRSTITEHITNVFEEGELERIRTCRNFRQVRQEGARKVEREVDYYNLDVIISVGYRVKSKQGTQFRIWATNVLRDYMLKGYALNQRMNRIENNVETLASKVQEIDFQIKSKELPDKGLFFEGQVFDAYTFASDLVRNAKKSIILIDNYVDDTVLTLLSKRKKEVSCTIYTKTISRAMQLDLERHNSQYPAIEIREWSTSHDRFLLIDEEELYHIGASLKDLGKRWFGFSRMDSLAQDVLNKLREGGDNE